MNTSSKINSAKTAFEQEKNKAEQAFEQGKDKVERAYEQSKDKAESMYEQAKGTVSDLYKEGKKKVDEAQDTLQVYSNELVSQIKDKPLSTILIAGAIGYLFSALFRK